VVDLCCCYWPGITSEAMAAEWLCGEDACSELAPSGGVIPLPPSLIAYLWCFDHHSDMRCTPPELHDVLQAA